MRQEAGDYLNDYGYEIPIHILADKVSEICQLYTQHAYMRPLCVVSLLFAIDQEKGPQLIKIDPAGHFVGYKATSCGEKEQSAMNHLEREFKKAQVVTVDDTFKTSIKCLQNVNNFLTTSDS